jgi:arginyl-tRNA synthetase
VEKEYYVNDSGRQIRTLGQSVLVRYKQLLGETVDLPQEGYQGGYIKELARMLLDKEGQSLADLPEEEAIGLCAGFAADKILTGIQEDLVAFGVSFDNWFNEQSLYDSGAVEAVLQECKGQGVSMNMKGRYGLGPKTLVMKRTGSWFAPMD